MIKKYDDFNKMNTKLKSMLTATKSIVYATQNQ